MAELAWMEFNRSGHIISKRKEFKSNEAMERYIEKLFKKDSFYKIIGYRNN